MQQVLFHLPFLKSWFPPDGFPIYGFGAMLFVTFVVCTWWLTRRGSRVGMPPERVQDMAIWVFVAGIVGARILYMIQYANQFPGDIGGLILSFFQIWKGGIIFYGSALGGAAGYGLFYWFVLRRLKVSGWQLADAVAPVLALGLAIGRIGCYLNGCCWGQAAVEETCPVPLGGAHFPLLPAHARDMLVRDLRLQTSTGFAVLPRDRSGFGGDPRSVVRAVEPGSPADQAGLKAGDRIVTVNGRPNAIVVEVGTGAQAGEILAEMGKQPGARVEHAGEDRPARAYFDNPADYVAASLAVRRDFPTATVYDSDSLGELARYWPRGRHDLELGVERNGQEVNLPPFVPKTVTLYPTQLYETVSMGLLILLLLAYYPFRRHDGQLLTMCMMGYSIHRFVNESIRIEPAVGLGLTLSQWGSVVIFAAAVGIELYLWQVMPSRWAAGYQDPPAPPLSASAPAASTVIPPASAPVPVEGKA
jgi:prolipoprotein diacylglyceryltransferase